MLGYFVIGALAAYGFFCVLWALFGGLLPDGRGCAVCCFGIPEEHVLWRYRWLRGMGLLRCPLLVVTDRTDTVCAEAEICTGEELLSRLEEERCRHHGTGTGDTAGRGERSGISEL